MINKNLLGIGTRTALYANVKRAKVSAVAFTSSGEIIATAHNRKVCGHPGKWTEHAEEVLIQKLERLRAFQRFNNITILVLRVCATGLAIAKPCPKCQRLLDRYKVSILYSSRTGEIKKLEET